MSQSLAHQQLNSSLNFSTELASVLSINDFGLEQTPEERIYLYDLLLSWQGVCMITISCILILITALGNILVICAIITTRRLRTVTNCFVMSLAVADFLVGAFVMPPAVAVHLMGSWRLGWILCDIWISLDILLCTASILSLCAISVDRYLAVTKPLKYSRRRRSKRLALLMILIVWLLALAITCPPMLGWYEPGRRDKNECRYNQNTGYVIYSASGSFFVPMIVMLYVYARISCVIASRHDQMTHIGVSKKHIRRYTTTDTANYIEKDFIDLTNENNSIDRRFSNQTIVNELNDVIMPELENARPLLYLPTTPMKNGSNKNQIEALTHVVSWKMPTSNGPYKYNNTKTLRLQYAHSCPPGTLAHLHVEPHDGQLKRKQLQQQCQQQQQHHQHQHDHQQQLKSLANCIISMKKEHKTTQTLSIVVGGFIACWLPFFIYYLITPFLEPHQVSRTITNVLTWLGWLNSAINPFIYAFYSNDFRLAFWRIVFKRFCSNVLRPSQAQTTITSMRL